MQKEIGRSLLLLLFNRVNHIVDKSGANRHLNIDTHRMPRIAPGRIALGDIRRKLERLGDIEFVVGQPVDNAQVATFTARELPRFFGRLDAFVGKNFVPAVEIGQAGRIDKFGRPCRWSPYRPHAICRA